MEVFLTQLCQFLKTGVPQMTFQQMYNAPSPIILVSLYLTNPLHCISSPSLLGRCIDANTSVAAPKIIEFLNHYRFSSLSSSE